MRKLRAHQIDPIEVKQEMPKPMNDRDELKLLDDINLYLTKVEKKEHVNKEKITNLPVKRRNRDRKRRWRTHFTQSKSRKRRKELSHRKVLNIMKGFGKGKKLLGKKTLIMA